MYINAEIEEETQNKPIDSSPYSIVFVLTLALIKTAMWTSAIVAVTLSGVVGQKIAEPKSCDFLTDKIEISKTGHYGLQF